MGTAGRSGARHPVRWPGGLRHPTGPAESCCLPTLTRFTGGRRAGPGHRTRRRKDQPSARARRLAAGRPPGEPALSTGPAPATPRRPPGSAGRSAGARTRTSLTGRSAGPGPDRRATDGRPWPARLGGVRERPNRHDWKSCVGQPTVGSNPTSSAGGSLRKWGPRGYETPRCRPVVVCCGRLTSA